MAEYGFIIRVHMPKSSKAKALLDFEITFYQQLLDVKPDFVDALMALGEAYTRRGWHEKGLEVDLKLTRLRSGDPVIWYNVACSYSLLKRYDDALTALQQAIAIGYDDFDFLLHDADLAALRQQPQFRQWIQSLRSTVKA